MDLNEYMREIDPLAVYPTKVPDDITPDMVGLIYVMLKLPGECAEISQHIGKAIRDDGFVITDERSLKLHKEIGDAFWYLVRACHHLGFDPEAILDENVRKLRGRQERGTLTGDGDDR